MQPSKTADSAEAAADLAAGRGITFRAGTQIDGHLIQQLLQAVPRDLDDRAHVPSVNLSDTTIKGDVSFENCTFVNSADFSQCSFEGGVVFDNCIFTAPTYFCDVEFHSPVFFQNVIFLGSASFSRMTCREAATFDSADWRAGVTFAQAFFESTASFRPKAIVGDADFNGTTWVRARQIGPLHVAGKIALREARFQSRVTIVIQACEVDLSGVVIDAGGAIQINAADILPRLSQLCGG